MKPHGYQPSDEHRGHAAEGTRPLVVSGFVAGLIVLLVVAHAGALAMFWATDRPLVREPGKRVMPGVESRSGPRHWAKPTETYTDWRESEMKRLNTYGWVDAQERVIHIPIERAMEQIVERAAEDSNESR